MKSIIAWMLPLFIAAGSAAALAQVSGAPRAISMEKRAAPALLEQCSRKAPTGAGKYFEPNAAQLRALNAALPVYFAQARDKPPRPLFEYTCQYAGLVTPGKKLIYGNCFPHSPRASATRSLYVCDGGPDYWGFEFDAVSSKVSNVAFNVSVPPRVLRKPKSADQVVHPGE